MDIGVVGGGIAGLTTSYHLLNTGVVSTITIFERRTSGPYKHCTGLVSLETLTRLPLAIKFIENMYKSIIFFIHGMDFGLEIGVDKYFVYRINRVRHEIELIHTLNEMGATINLGCEVSNIDVDNNKYLLTLRKNGLQLSDYFDRIVIAEGYPPLLSRKCGLIAKYDTLKALQEEVLLSNPLGDDQVETLYIFISPKFFGKGFAWMVPIDRYRIIIGYSTGYRTSVEELEDIRLIFKNILGLSYRSVEDIYGGIVLQGYPIKISVNGIVGIGDGMAMVKSISGGGLYAISLISKLYSEGASLRSRDVRGLFNSLKLQYITKNVIWSMLRIIKYNSGTVGRIHRFMHLNIKHLDYDRHEQFIYTFLTSLPNLKLKKNSYTTTYRRHLFS